MSRCLSHLGTPHEHDVRIVSNGLDILKIQALPLLARFDNEWRQRKVRIYADPEDPSKVYTIGASYNDCERILTHEPRAGFEKEIRHWERTGREYIYL